jgi:hypothetical protein
MWPKPYPSSETIYVALCRWLKSKHKKKQKALKKQEKAKSNQGPDLEGQGT